MRTVSGSALAKITAQYGSEPIVVLEIQWVPDGPRLKYADREIAAYGIKGKVHEISNLDAITQVSNGGDSSEIDVSLSDIDSEIKTILDTTDIHLRPCWVYQYFDGLDYTTDKFLLFKGFINSPVSWTEGDRMVKFTVINKIEDVEIGFSIEEGDFNNPPQDIIGQAWPLCFGTVINVPILKATSLLQGTLAKGVGIVDPTLLTRLECARLLECTVNFEAYKLQYALNGAFSVQPFMAPDPNCVHQKCREVESLNLQYTEQKSYEFDTIEVYGGENFPQNKKITIDINGAKFTGRMNGTEFTISGRRHPSVAANGVLDLGGPENEIASACPEVISKAGTGGLRHYIKKYWGNDEKANTIQEVRRSVDFLKVVRTFDLFFTGQAATPEEVTATAVADRETHWILGQIPSLDFFWCNGGSKVTYDPTHETVYVANILPSTIHRVAAFRNTDQGRLLCTVPETYYTVRETDYSTYDVMEIVFDRLLSSRLKEGWEDSIYVTLTSTVGPNTVDIIQWIIETYTDFQVDTTSFDEVRDLIENYPSHFPILDRPNVVTALQDIAYQARCALYLRDDVFFIKYLPLEPDADMTIDGLTEMEQNSLELTHTDTEDLVTKYTVTWQEDYALDEPNKVILRHNVKKYGTHEEERFFFIYNIHELVVKSATYWLIRKSMTWRKLRCVTHFNKLQLETFDCAAITHSALSDSPVKCICEKADFDTDSRRMEFEFWTPIPSGSRTPYNFAWPADIEETDLFPSAEERQQGLGGSGRDPNFHTIAPEGHILSNQQGQGSFTVEQCAIGGGDAGFVGSDCRGDHGDKKPSDRGDVKPTPKRPKSTGGGENTSTNPLKKDNNWIINEFAKKMADANNEAKKAKEDAARANQNAGGDPTEDDAGGGDPSDPNDEADAKRRKLPRSKGGNCTVGVTVLYGIPTTIHRRPDETPYFGSEEGDTGAIVFINNTRLETHTFNSMTAAVAFRDSMAAAINAKALAYGFVVGTETAYQTGMTAPDLGIDGDATDENGEPNPNYNQPCQEPDAADQAQTGFFDDDLSTGADDAPSYDPNDNFGDEEV